MALRKVGVIPLVTHVFFKIIFVFTPTEQAQKGCDPGVHPRQQPAPEEEVRTFRAGNCPVQLPSPIGERSVCALRKDGTPAQKERQNRRSLLHPQSYGLCLSKASFNPEHLLPIQHRAGRVPSSASAKPAGLKDKFKIKIQHVLLKCFND